MVGPSISIDFNSPLLLGSYPHSRNIDHFPAENRDFPCHISPFCHFGGLGLIDAGYLPLTLDTGAPSKCVDPIPKQAFDWIYGIAPPLQCLIITVSPHSFATGVSINEGSPISWLMMKNPITIDEIGILPFHRNLQMGSI